MPFSDIMKRLNKNMHGNDEAFYRLRRPMDERILPVTAMKCRQ